MKRLLWLFAAFLSCAPSRPHTPLPGIVELTHWNQNQMTFCCQAAPQETTCPTEDWLSTIQNHCRGKSSIVKKENASCATYSCSEWVRAYDVPSCSPLSQRTVRLKIFVDSTVSQLPAWESIIQTAVSNTNWYFKPLQISFIPSIIEKTQILRGGDPMDEAFDYLEKHHLDEDADFFIAFITQRIMKKRGWQDVQRLGEAKFLNNQLVMNIRDRDSINQDLAHELGHVFGAFHVPNESSIMNALHTQESTQVSFDPVSTKIIRLNKCADLKKGPLDIANLQYQMMGKIFATQYPPEKPHPIGLTLWDLADSMIEKDVSKELSFMEKAVLLQPHFPLWSILRGEAKMKAEQYEAASKDFELALLQLKTVPQMQDDDWEGAKNVNMKSIALADLGDTYYFRKQPQEAKKYAKQALSENSNEIEALILMGMISLDENVKSKAVDYFEKALSLNPKSERAKKGLTQAKK